MKKAVRKGASKAVALVLSLAMIFGMAPMVSASAGNTADAQDNFDRIVHLDMGRKYYSPEWIKALIQEISALGYTELELDFSNNEGFRFSLPAEQMQIEVGGYETVLVEVEPDEGAQDVEEPVTAVPLAGEETAVPAPTSTAQPEEGESEPAVTDEPESTPQYKEVEVFQSKTVDLSQALSQDGYITADQMEDIIDCADKAGIEIVPLLNSPGHMGAILNVEEFQGYRWTDNQGRTSKSTIDLENEEAVRFAQGVVGAYAQWFSEHGCETFNIGADEFANDIGEMGLDHIYREQRDVYSELIDYINDLAVIVQGYGMTPRAFNDSFCYSNDTDYAPSTDIQVCYWSSGWGYSYNLAKASTLDEVGYDLINTHGDYYYILGGKDDCWDNGNARYDFDNNVFPGSTISDPVGSMFCIWSDYPDAESQQKVAEKVRLPLRIMAARMQDREVSAGTVDTSVIPGGFNTDGSINTDVPSVTVEDKGIKVTAPGLTGITVSEATVKALRGDYVAYDMTPVAGNKNYEGRAEVSIPLGKMARYEASELTGFVVGSDGKITEIPGEVSGDSYVFTMPHFSVGGVMLRSGSVTETREITVTVGQTETDTITGENYAGAYTTDNPDVATVTVTGEDAGTERVTYTEKTNVKCSELLDHDSNSWVETKYYYTPDGGKNYYPLYAKRSRTAGWKTYIWGYKVKSTGNVEEIKKQEASWFDPEVDITLYEKSTIPATEASTTVTFQGKSVGDTTVTVGHVKYDIHVTAEDLSRVSPLTVELFITNRRLNYNDANTIKIEAQAAATEEGYQFSDVPTHITYGGVEYAFWKVVEIDYDSRANATHEGTGAGGSGQIHKGTSGDIQCTCDGSDKTMADDTHTMTAVRYYNGGWQYQNTNGQWVDIKDNDQLVAYYLQVTDVTTELETQVVDYGARQDGFYLIGNGDWALLDFQVEYPSGFYPNDFANGKTLLYHNNAGAGRTIGMIRASLNDPYYVLSRIEVLTASSTNYSGARELSQIDIQYDEDSAQDVWTSESGGDPVVPSLTFGSSNGKDNVKLVRYVLEVNPEYSNLTVHYINETSGQEFHSYDIATRTAGESVEEAEDFADWTLTNGKLTPGVITNALGREETVYYRTNDLGRVPDMNPAYTSGFFEFANKITVSSDGDDLYLYYSTDKNADTAIVDFGLPVKIAPTFFDQNAIAISAVGDSGSGVTGKYGTLKKDGSGNYVYTPSQIMNGSETFRMKVTIGEQSIDWMLYVVPASTVYYEDSFVVYSDKWKVDGSTAVDRTQATSKLGSGDIYGYDTAYAKDTTYSGGSAHKVTLGSGETATASFTFRGTGFQLVSATDSTSGCIIVNVNGNGVDKYYFVDCYYQNGGALNQVPVMKVDNLPLGTYTVTVTAGHLSSFDWNKDGESTFVLDGIRIYKPVGDYENYKQDNEGSAVYSEIRNILIGDWKDSNSVYVDTLNESTKDFNKYLKVGPNNEVYLKNGDKITFTVPEGGSIVQIGAKLVSGSKMTFTVKNQSQSITSAAEMYYLLNGVKPGNEITITATEGDGILSLTNLKLVSGS